MYVFGNIYNNSMGINDTMNIMNPLLTNKYLLDGS